MAPSLGPLPDWTGQPAAVLGAGASAARLAPLLRGRCRIVAVNLSFRLVPDADVLYAADSGFWLHYRDAHRFSGLKLAPDEHCRRYCPSVELVEIARDRRGRRVEDLVRGPPGVVGSGGGNSGFQALNVAVQLGADPIYLAGLDFRGSHWHADHGAGLRNPTDRQLDRWREVMDRQAGTLRRWGVRVINLSETSALRAYPHGQADRDLADTGPSALQA